MSGDRDIAALETLAGGSGETLELDGPRIALRPAALRELPALRRLAAAAAGILGAEDLAAAVAEQAERLAEDLARLTGTEREVWLAAPWGTPVVAMLAVLRANTAYVSGPFAAGIAAQAAAIPRPAGES